MKFKRKSATPASPGKNLTKIRWVAWLMLAALSVFFSEVVSGSTPAAFFNIYGLLVVCSLYFLQLMVLLPFIFRTGKPGTATLYLAGALLGLFEAYITKVIWSPAGSHPDVFAGGVAVFTTLMLVFFWHPFMSVILPLFTADGLLNAHKTLKIKMPFKFLSRVKPALLIVILGGVMGVIHGAAVTGGLARALFSALSSVLIIGLLLRIWKYLTGKTIFTLGQLLPNPSQWKIFVFLLAADYLALALSLRFDAFPAWPGHVIVLALYTLIGGLLLLARKRDARLYAQRMFNQDTVQTEQEAAPAYVNISGRSWLLFSLAFVLLSGVASLLQEWSRTGVHYVVWGAGILAGLLMFGWSVLQVAPEIKLQSKLPNPRNIFYHARNRIRSFRYAFASAFPRKQKPAAETVFKPKPAKARISLPRIRLPRIRLPRIRLPKFHVPEIRIPKPRLNLKDLLAKAPRFSKASKETEDSFPSAPERT
jgi:hypothetical protein